jgi:hypothetical protein
MLRKLAKAAQKIHADMERRKRIYEGCWMNVLDADMHCCGSEKLTPKQRAKIEQQLERDQQFFECAQLEYGKKSHIQRWWQRWRACYAS